MSVTSYDRAGENAPTLAELPIWVAWRYEERNGKTIKVPINPRTGRYAKTNDPATWAPRRDAEAWARENNAVGIGVVLTQVGDLHFGGIDCDTCRDPQTGAIEPWARAVIERFASYTEVSPSGTGVKIFFFYPLAMNAEHDALLARRGHKFARSNGEAEHPPASEIYGGDRYFTVTGELFENRSDLRSVPLEDIRWLVEEAGPAFVGRPMRGNGKATATAKPRERLAHAAGNLLPAKGETRMDGPTPVAAMLSEGGSGDNSRSAKAWRLGARLKAQGASYEQMRDALLNSDNPDVAAWADEKGLANDERELKRIYERAVGSQTRAPAPPIEPAADVDPAQFRPTDAGNALLFVDLFKRDLRYVEKWKAWLVWNGKRWVETSDTEMLPLARAATECMFAAAAQMADEDKQKKLRAHALASQREPRLQAMLDLAKGEPAIRIEPAQLDADPLLLGCPNGTLDLRTGEPREPRREDFITKSIAVDFDPAAQCPNWMKLLKFVAQNDEETMEHLQRVVGYALTGDVSEEKLFAFFGSGDNGKTTFVETLTALMGDYAMRSSRDLLLERQGKAGAASPDVAALVGKRLVVVSETDDGCMLNEAQVKSVTSNARVPARRLHRDPFDFMPTHKTFLDTNHRPFVKGTDDGIWRRLNIVGFKAKIAEGEKSPDFREKRLMPELPGILRWATDGCLKWRRDGLKPSKAVREATLDYRSEMDFIANWLEERADKNPNRQDTVAALFEDYRTWADTNVYPKLGRKRFGEELERRGFTSSKSNGVWVRKGLKLKKTPTAFAIIRGGRGGA